MILIKICRSAVFLMFVWTVLMLVWWLLALFNGIPAASAHLAVFNNKLFTIFPSIVFAGYSARVLLNSIGVECLILFAFNLSIVAIYSIAVASFVDDADMDLSIFGVFAVDFGVVNSAFYLLVLVLFIWVERRSQELR